LKAGKVKILTQGGIATEVREPLARDSVRNIHATLRALLNAAVDDGIILANPADKLGRALRLIANAKARQENIKAMTREQVSGFLAAAQNSRRYSPLFLLLARTGMRLGEALALQWDDVDISGHAIRVARTVSSGRIETPKSGHGRSI